MEFYKSALSNFIFQEKKGEGTHSRCFLATEKETKQKCAVLLSCFSSSKISLIIDRILAQIKILTKITCPVIPKLIDYNINISSKYINKIIITEFIPNGTLSHIISMNRMNYKSKWTETKKFINFYGIAYGMSYLHSLNIIHRDLTTKNILLDEYLYPKIINFRSGLDLNINEKTEKTVITDINNSEEEHEKPFKNDPKIDKNSTNRRFNNENLDENEENNEKFFEENLFENIKIIQIDEDNENLIGTPSYIAPEIYELLKYSKSSDVYSFSIILYEILTSQIPYEFKANHQIARYVTEGGRPDLKNKEIPECYIQLLKKCWNQEPTKRPTFQEIVTELRTNKKYMKELNVEEEEFENYRKLIEEKIKPKTEKIQIVKEEKKVEDLSIEIKEIDLSEYKLDKLINQDSFSNVYKIIENKTNNIYEAKISHKTIYEYSNIEMITIKREITILSKIKFPSIIKFIGYNKRDFSNHFRPTIITEFVKYQSLEEIINKLNDTKKLIIIYGIASAMSYLHSLNIIHRDLKPSNIYLDENLYPKIGNFHFSKEINRYENEEDKNIGTLLFMAPEILTENKYYKASDVYSFALIVYYILTIKKLYKGFKYIDIIKKVPKGIRPDFPSNIPFSYRELIEKCWSNDFNKRPTFDDIIQTIKTNPRFITDKVDKNEFFNYMKYIDDEQTQIENYEYENIEEEEEEEVSDDIKEDFVYYNLIDDITDITDTDVFKEERYDEINKKEERYEEINNKKTDDNKKESSKKIENLKDYIEIEDKNSNYAEQIKKLNESIGNENQVLKISFKFNTSKNIFKEENSSDFDKEEKNENDTEIDSILLKKEESVENQTKSKKAVKKRKKPRRKQKSHQYKIEQNKNVTIDTEDEEEYEDSEDEILIKEKENIRKIKEDENRKEKERILKEKEERLKKEKEDEIRKEKERILKEEEERLKKEEEEKLRKEEERLKEEKIREEREEKLRKEKEEKLRKEEKIRKEKEEEERLTKEQLRKEEKIRKEKEEKLRKEKEEEERLTKEQLRNEESSQFKDEKNYSSILSKYKDVEDVVIMQLEPTKNENRVTFSNNDESKMKPKTANQIERPSNKSPRRQKEIFSDSKTKRFPMPSSQKTDNQKTIINPIKLTVTLKDIGMEKFDTKNQENQQQQKEIEKQNQTKLDQNSEPTRSELPKLNHYNKYSNPSQKITNSQSQTENKLPKLIRDKNPTISIPNKQNQLNLKPPRRNKESSSNYDPSIFYSHSNNITINQNKSLMTNRDDVVKNPIKLKITLKDIGMESFDSTQSKTKKVEECEKTDNKDDGERPISRRYQRL